MLSARLLLEVLGALGCWHMFESCSVPNTRINNCLELNFLAIWGWVKYFFNLCVPFVLRAVASTASREVLCRNLNKIDGVKCFLKYKTDNIQLSIQLNSICFH